MDRPARLKDVADHAGVSVATASAVARGLEDGPIRVSAQTRIRVEQAIAELDYRPNRAARSLRTQRSGMVAVVVPDITNPLFPQLIRAAQLRLEEAGMLVSVWDSHRDVRRERAAVESILDRQLEGAVLVTEHLQPDEVEPLVTNGIAVAAVDRRLELDGVDLVSEDLVEGARLAVRHLVDHGHRRIAHVAGGESVVADARLEGYRTALREAGLDDDPDLVVGGAFDRAAGERAVPELLSRNDPPTAVFAVNDVVAIGVLRACHHHGVDVPGDLAVIGVDNTPEADAVIPGLTTMDVRPATVAERLIDLLLTRLGEASPPPERRELITPVLVPRGTT